MMRGKPCPILFLMFALLVPVLASAAAAEEVHASELPELTRDGPYPRLTTEELAASGFPDHKHLYYQRGWEPLTDETGKAYGPGSICRGMIWLDREDVYGDAEQMRVGLFKLEYNRGFRQCQMAPFLETCELALMDVAELLDLTATDTLHVINTNMADAYAARTSQGVWRMYKRAGDLCVIQPIPILVARTLVGHAAYDLVVGWVLDENGCRDLPHWLRQGLMAYVAELGVHLNNYMLQFRPRGDILLTPSEVDRLFAAPPIPHDTLDREMYRKARYAAFLMVWRLVEERGGMTSMRRFLTAVRDGRDADEACTEIYGADLAGLAASLDPTVLGEPQGEAIQARKPHLKPIKSDAE